MTVTGDIRPTRQQRRVDPLAVPIAIKLAIGLGIVMLISSIVTSGLMQSTLATGVTDATLSELSVLSRSEAERVWDTLGQETVALTRLSQEVSIQSQLLEKLTAPDVAETYIPLSVMEARLVQFVSSNPEFDAVAIVDGRGHLVAIEPRLTDEAEIAALPAPGNWTWFDSAFNNGEGQTVITGPVEDQLTGITGAHIALPVYASGNPNLVLGVVYGIWNLSNIPEIAQVRDRDLILLEPDGSVLFGTQMSRGQTISTTLLNDLRARPDTSLVHTSVNGETWLIGATDLGQLALNDPRAASLRWFIVIREPIAATEESVLNLVRGLQLAIAASALTVTILAAVLAGFLLNPLRQLTESAERLRTGQLDTPIPVLPRDEVGTLADVLRDLVARLVNRVAQLNSAVEVSRVSAYALDVRTLAQTNAEALAREFRYSAVIVYLTEEGGQFARQQGLSGMSRQEFAIADGLLRIDETSVAGRSILLGEPQFGTRMARGGRGFEDPFQEIAIPLRLAGRVRGTMHILTRSQTPFTQEDLDVLTLITDQLGAGLQNARLYQESQRNVDEIEALNRRLTRQGWQETLGESALRHTLNPESQWPDIEQLKAGEEIRASIHEDQEGRSVLAAPVVLRGESVGTLAVTRNPGETWTRDEMLLMEAVAGRLAMIAEGVRLVEESSERALREEQVNSVSASLLQRAASVDSVLQTALNELSGVLGSDHVSLRIGQPPIDDDRQLGSGS